jgi:hypothetical protein
MGVAAGKRTRFTSALGAKTPAEKRRPRRGSDPCPVRRLTMPGPVSESYDPEFGTGENADALATAIRVVRKIVTDQIAFAVKGDTELKLIMDVVRGPNGMARTFSLDERQLRIIRFCLDRSLESI